MSLLKSLCWYAPDPENDDLPQFVILGLSPTEWVVMAIFVGLGFLPMIIKLARAG